MSKQKYLGVSGLNLNIKPYQEKPKEEEPQSDDWDWFFKPVITGDATIEALKQPGALFNKGASQLSDNPLAGLLNIGQGIAGIPFLLATVPLAMGEDFLKTGDKLVGTTDKEGKPSGVGNFISEGINGVFEIPAQLYDLGRKTIDAGLKEIGSDADFNNRVVKNALIRSFLMPKDATEQDFKDTQEALDEAGKLGLTLLAFEGVKLGKNKLAPEIKDIKVIPKEIKDVPQDVKQTLQLEAPKQNTFNQINVDPTGRNKTIPKTETTQAYTKLELFRDELSAKKDKLVSDREILKKQAFDKDLTKEQRIDAKNKLKAVTEELNNVSKRLPLVNKELQNKKFEVESKPIPEQKLLTEGVKEPISTENVPSNIDFSLPKEKTVEIGKETGLKGLPVEKGQNAKEPIVGDVAELQKPTEVIERRTDKAGKDFYYNTETKKRTSKTEFEKQKVEEKPVEDVKPETKEIKTYEQVSNAETPEITNFLKKEIGDTEVNKIIEEASNRPENKIPIEGKTEIDMQSGAIEDALRGKAQEIVAEKTKPIESIKTETKVEGKIEDAVKPEILELEKRQNEELAKTKQIIEDAQVRNERFIKEKNLTKEQIADLPTEERLKLNSEYKDWLEKNYPELGERPDRVKPKSESTIDRLKREALDEYKNNASKTNIGFNPLGYKAGIKLGAYHIKNGVVKFADWSAQMVKDLGEKIKPQLLRIWSEVKKFGEDLGKIGLEKIGEFIDSKYNPARPMKMVDLNLLNKELGIEPTSPKSPKITKENAFSEGMKDISKKDRETIKQEYREQIKEKERLGTKVKGLIKEVQDIKKIAKTVFEPISTSVEKVSKDVFRRFRLFGQSYQTNLLKRHEAVGDYFDVKKKSKITPDELADYNISLLNGWFDDAKAIAKKYGFDKELDKVLKVKDDLAKELGVKTLDNHFPRMVEDFDGFVKFLEQKFPDYYKDNFSRMIAEKTNKVGRELTVEEKATLINNALRGYNPGITLSDVGNMKKRVIETLDGELAKFYSTPDVSLLKYINEMTELSEGRKFFGKGYDVNESIGAYIQELRDGKKIDLEGSRELMEVFKSRFNQRTITNKGITALRDIGVITKLGNPYSTMTQLKDLAYSMYFDPLRTPVELAKIIGNKITGKTPEWQIKELGIDPLKIAEELANPKKRKEYVQAFLDYSGFSKLDMIGKETLINTLWQKYQKQSKDVKLNTEFERRIERYFGKGEEKTKVLNDLKNGKKTDSTAFLLYNELTGAQPISLTEMPRGYLKGGNWRIAYFLKTFSIRQLDFALNETVRVMRDKSLPKEQRRQGAYNLMKLTTSLALTGATVDQIRSYLMNALTGKKNDQTFTDDMLDNLLNVSLLSRYDYTKTRRNGISESIGSKVLPPMDFLSDPLIYDLPNIIEEKGTALKSTKHIPMFGKFIYEYLKDNKRGSRNSSRNTSRNTER